MLQEEDRLLKQIENLRKFRLSQSGFSIEFPTDLLTNIIDNISEVRRKVCFTNAQLELTEYCNNLKKVAASAKRLIDDFNGTIKGLSLEMTMVEEVPGIISSNVNEFLSEASTERVLFRLKDIFERDKDLL